MKNLCLSCLLIIPLLAYTVSASLSPKISLVGNHSCDEQMPGLFKNLKDHSTELEGIRTGQLLPLLQTSFDAQGERKGAAHQPAPKKVKLDLNFPLGLPGVEKEEASPSCSSYNYLNQPESTIPAGSLRIFGKTIHISLPTISTAGKHHDFSEKFGNAIAPPPVFIKPLANESPSPSHPEASTLMRHSQEAGNSRNLGSERNASSLGLIEHQMPLIEDFRLENINRKMWAWVSVIVHVLLKRKQEQMRRHIGQLMWTLHSKHKEYQIQKSHMGRNADSNIHLGDQIDQFCRLLLILNFRVLQVLGLGLSDVLYSLEQGDFIHWLIEVVLGHQDSYLTNNSFQEQKFPGGVVESLHQKIYRALNCQEEDPLYRIKISWKSFPVDPIIISKKQVAMNEAAVELLGSYYKSKNLRKWDKVFHDTRFFVLQIGNIDPDWMRTGHQDRKIKFKDLEAAKLFPWKDDVVDDLAGDVLKNKAMKSSYLEKFVELIGFKDPSIKLELDQRLHLSNSKRFYIPKQFTQTWNKIIRITLVKMKEVSQEYIPDDSFVSDMRGYIASGIERSMGLQAKSSFLSTGQDKFTEMLKRICVFISSINSVFMESLGCDQTEDAFFQEQTLVQKYFEFLASTLKMGVNQGHIIENQTLEEFLIGLFTSEKTEPIYSGKRSWFAKSYRFNYSENDIQVMKLAVYTIGCYYKNQDPIKWEVLFPADQKLLDLIAKYSSICYNFRLPNYRRDYLTRLKPYKLFPWIQKIQDVTQHSSFHSNKSHFNEDYISEIKSVMTEIHQFKLKEK
ncbi:hypothetical protein PGT21_017696 [Puccinia graminis f. sp. tritici]|uniref:Uncharacterized protein n=1 Tax=Puccinia graminis f. sp. tritici TaxID=56615 RepID=A0A5B0NV90_PUCGR|nr:hypothetical protein PGT21_017696 [Puccinia graminis f. sp. tritici]